MLRCAPGAEVPKEDFVIIESMPVKSIITSPQAGTAVAGRELAVRGHAWAGDHSVSAVDVSIDFGATWQRAKLQKAPNRYSWQTWSANLGFPTNGYYEIWSRVTDDRGVAQPFAVAWNPRGYAANAADAVAGAQAFAVCGACHSVEAGGGARIGPNLWGVVGRTVGSAPGFDYSEELKAVGGSWTPEQLDRFLADPNGFAPGTRMGYTGVADPAERAAIIAYLGTLRPGAVVVAQPAQDFGPDWPAGPGQVEAGALCNSCHSLAIVKQQRLSRYSWDTLLTWMVE